MTFDVSSMPRQFHRVISSPNQKSSSGGLYLKRARIFNTLITEFSPVRLLHPNKNPSSSHLLVYSSPFTAPPGGSSAV